MTWSPLPHVPGGSGHGSENTWPQQGWTSVCALWLRGQNRPWAGRQDRKVFCARGLDVNLGNEKSIQDVPRKGYKMFCGDGGVVRVLSGAELCNQSTNVLRI